MLFTIQSHLEDFFSSRNMLDTDGYAVDISNLYFHERLSHDDNSFHRRMGRIRTIFFKRNKIAKRAEFEQTLLNRLDQKFKKKLASRNQIFPGGLKEEKKVLQKLSRRTMLPILERYKQAIESKAIDNFWLSRTKNQLRKRPETIAQGLLTLFIDGTLGNNGIVLRECASGVGYIDIGVIFSRALHLVELKVLTNHFTGADQLEQYMKNEKRPKGYLVVIDSLPHKKKKSIPKNIKSKAGLITVLHVDINPIPPSKISP